ncbi:MAG: methyltransferase domain-containing protein [Woeseiaceae bacterium]
MTQSKKAQCRFCDSDLDHVLVDLGMSPLCQTQIQPEQLNSMEAFYPLLVHVCGSCFLVQLEEYVTPDNIFTEYAYFSSYSDSWVAHAKAYCEKVTQRLDLGTDSLVMEIASNDGYLLQHFVADNVPVLGIEPAANVAEVAREKGVRTENRFLGEQSAKELVAEYGKADLVVGNNVLAHVPDIKDFVSGISILLAETGTVTMEFPHLIKLMELNQFDTIYHEHFSYLSWFTVSRIFEAHGMELFDVEQLNTHGGSLRIYGRHKGAGDGKKTAAALELEAQEKQFGVDDLGRYTTFTDQVKQTKRALLSFLVDAKSNGKTVVGYGAPGKGNTLLNYCGIREDFLDYTVDRNPYKQGTYTPGTHIPILDPEEIAKTKPDYVLILPWNLRDEISEQMAYIREWGGQFVVPIPTVEVF